jgi:hypothetical protein
MYREYRVSLIFAVKVYLARIEVLGMLKAAMMFPETGMLLH